MSGVGSSGASAQQLKQKQIYFTLPDNASKKFYPGNTPNNYKVKLPEPLKLPGPGSWFAGIRVIQFSCQFKPHFDAYKTTKPPGSGRLLPIDGNGDGSGDSHNDGQSNGSGKWPKGNRDKRAAPYHRRERATPYSLTAYQEVVNILDAQDVIAYNRNKLQQDVQSKPDAIMSIVADIVVNDRQMRAKKIGDPTGYIRYKLQKYAVKKLPHYDVEEMHRQIRVAYEFEEDKRVTIDELIETLRTELEPEDRADMRTVEEVFLHAASQLDKSELVFCDSADLRQRIEMSPSSWMPITRWFLFKDKERRQLKCNEEGSYTALQLAAYATQKFEKLGIRGIIPERLMERISNCTVPIDQIIEAVRESPRLDPVLMMKVPYGTALVPAEVEAVAGEKEVVEEEEEKDWTSIPDQVRDLSKYAVTALTLRRVVAIDEWILNQVIENQLTGAIEGNVGMLVDRMMAEDREKRKKVPGSVGAYTVDECFKFIERYFIEYEKDHGVDDSPAIAYDSVRTSLEHGHLVDAIVDEILAVHNAAKGGEIQILSYLVRAKKTDAEKVAEAEAEVARVLKEHGIERKTMKKRKRKPRPPKPPTPPPPSPPRAPEVDEEGYETVESKTLPEKPREKPIVVKVVRDPDNVEPIIPITTATATTPEEEEEEEEDK